MKWLLRFIGWATLLAIPCFFVSHPWQSVLGSLTERILALFGLQVEMEQVQVMAPFDLGIYVAMCLASRRAPGLARRQAIERGGLLVLLLEVVTLTVGVALYYVLPGGETGSNSRLRFTEYLIEFVPWANATVVWLIMLGSWELPATLRRAS